MHTDHESCTETMVTTHLKGVMGVGLVPILDNGTCAWAAIDIDNHGENEDTPIGAIDKIIVNKGLPLVPCRSKSGGVHVYAFFDTPWPSARARTLLSSYAAMLKYPKAEIFPKQIKLQPSGKTGEDRQMGNWLNMPYLGGDDTQRYAYRDGHRLTLDKFLTLAEHTKVTRAALYDRVMYEHPEAPPCIQSMMAEGVGKGQRNEALYNITVYARKAFPDDFMGVARDLNTSVFDTPLGKSEAERTIGSASKPEYRYRCSEEPQKGLCDRPTCLTRRHGITPADSETEAMIGDLPVFTELTKYVADPVRWEMKVDDKLVTNVPTEILLDWRKMRILIADSLTKIVPMIKPQEWERVLQPLMVGARIAVTPDDASASGMVRERLREFASKAHDLRLNKNVQDRQALLRGLPIIAVVDGVQQVVFRSQDFIAYLKRMKSDDLRGVNTWFAVREIGVRNTRMRVTKEKSINVWMLPYSEVRNIEVESPEFTSEI
jgi:hypothetical protein